mgnify:FL=1
MITINGLQKKIFFSNILAFIFSVLIYNHSIAQELYLIAGQSNAVGQGNYLKSPECLQ